jgi:hypothetical protein
MFGSTIDDDRWSFYEKNELILWKRKFQLNQNIEWHCMQFELNLNSIQIPKFNLHILNSIQQLD